DLRGRRLGRAALQLPRQVRFRDRLAQLHQAARPREHPRENGSLPLYGAHRSPLGARRFPSRTCVRRRARSHRVTLLHELRGAAVHSPGAARSGRVRAVPPAVPAGEDSASLTRCGPATGSPCSATSPIAPTRSPLHSSARSGCATGLGGERSIYTGSLVTSNGALHEAMLDTLSRATEGVA